MTTATGKVSIIGPNPGAAGTDNSVFFNLTTSGVTWGLDLAQTGQKAVFDLLTKCAALGWSVTVIGTTAYDPGHGWEGVSQCYVSPP
jgi:hypothetical protein